MNKIILMGRLTKDPEARYTQANNTMVTSFTLAVNRRFVRPGETQTADFFSIVAWTKTAEFVSRYFKKGMQVAVVGRLQNRTWDDPQGQRHYITEVVAEEVYFAEGRKNSDAGNFNANFGPDAASAESQVNQREGDASASDGNSDFDVSSGDDLPF